MVYVDRGYTKYIIFKARSELLKRLQIPKEESHTIYPEVSINHHHTSCGFFCRLSVLVTDSWKQLHNVAHFQGDKKEYIKLPIYLQERSVKK